MKVNIVSGPWLLSTVDRCFIYALGPNNVNSFWCQLQTAGQDKVSRDVLVDTAKAVKAVPDILDALMDIMATTTDPASKRTAEWALNKAKGRTDT